MKKLRTIAAIFSLCLFLLLLIPIIYPTSLNPDRGIFESVSYRLLAKDQLYDQVWDNKDPLFYYINALILDISPVADLFLELSFFLLLSMIVFNFNITYIVNKKLNVLISVVISSLIVIQINYFPGYTHLPGATLLLGIILFAVKGKEAFVGILMGLLLFTKITFFPIAVFTLLFLAYKKIIEIKVITKYFVLILTLMVFFMSFRDEFIPYLQSLNLNYIYTVNTPNRFDTFFSFFKSKIGAYSILLIAFILYSNISKFKDNRRVELQIINSMAISTFLVSIFTSKNYHHLQILMPLFLICTTYFFQEIYKRRTMLKVVIVLSLFYLIPSSQILNFKDGWNNLGRYYKNDLGKSLGESSLISISQTGTYARLGQNDDNAHAKGLQTWTLACPRFHQYPFDDPTTFKQTLECIDKAEYLIISPTFKEYSQTKAWNEFVKLSTIEVEKKYSCETYLSNRVCQNNGWRLSE